jgi:general secretion pathway protein J
MRNNQRGLTLVELLVSISVLAMISVLGWRGLDSIVRARIALTSELEQTRALQLTFAQLQSDCLHLATTSVLPDQTTLHIEPEQISLVRTVYADAQPSALQVVSYQLHNGVLTRRESPATRDLYQLDSAWQAVLEHGDTYQQIVLQPDVGAFKAKVWADDNKGWRDSLNVTAAALPVGATPPAPNGLEVTMQIGMLPNPLRKILLLGAL